MMIFLTRLGDETKCGILLENIKYIEEYNQKHSRVYLNGSTSALYFEESLSEISEIVNKAANNHTTNITIYQQKSLFGK
jgi:hypothetical protein